MARERMVNLETNDVQQTGPSSSSTSISISNLECGSIPIRARISASDDDDDDLEVDNEASEVSAASGESFTESLQVSPAGSVEGYYVPSKASIKKALRQLNELNGGLPSLDTSLLENISEDGFRFRVMEIALSNGLPLGDEVVHDILNSLTPVVRENFKMSSSVRDMPVAKLTVDDDLYDKHYEVDGIQAVDEQDEVDGSQAGSGEGSDLEASESGESPLYSALGLPVLGADEESVEHGASYDLPLLVLPVCAHVAKQELLVLEVGNGSATSEEVGRQVVSENEDAQQNPLASCQEGMLCDDEQPYTNILCSFTPDLLDVDSYAHTCLSLQQLEDSKGRASRSMDIASRRQMLESFVYMADTSIPHKHEQEDLVSIDLQCYLGRMEGDIHENYQSARGSLNLEQAGDLMYLEQSETGRERLMAPTKIVDVRPWLDERETETRLHKEHVNGAPNRGRKLQKLGMVDEPIRGSDIGTARDKSVVCFDKHVIDNTQTIQVMDAVTDNKGKESMTDSLVALAPDIPSLGAAGTSKPVRHVGLLRSEHGACPVKHIDRKLGTSSSVVSGDLIKCNDEKLQVLRVNLIRLAHRLGLSAQSKVIAHILYSLQLAEQLRGVSRSRDLSLEALSLLAEEQETTCKAELNFECTIMVLGKSGVGKSATINSLFDDVKSRTNAFKAATKRVQEIMGTIHGVKVRVIDTPGLLPSFSNQRYNERIMLSIKRHIYKSPPDIVLYVDRLDMQCRDYGDLTLLRTISNTLGVAIWSNVIIVLTHAFSAPPEHSNGVPLGYGLFVAQSAHIVQQTIRQAADDMRLMNQLCLVENHVKCPRNQAGQRVLPNCQAWKPQLLLLCFGSKVVSEASSFIESQDSSLRGPFKYRPRVPPLPFLSSLLQTGHRLNLTIDDGQCFGLEESDSDDNDYDNLPSFRRLTKDELTLLSKEQRRLYQGELDYREKLFLEKQLKEARARQKDMKRGVTLLEKEEWEEHPEEARAVVPVPVPEMTLPLCFDSGNPTHRCHFLEMGNTWLVRPVLEEYGWDHDCGYDGVSVEKLFLISKMIPVSLCGQLTKNKKESSMELECATVLKSGHGGKRMLGGLEIRTVGKEISYTLRGESKFINFKGNKNACGLSVTVLGGPIASGMKIEDQLTVGKRFKLVMNGGGALAGHGDIAYGGSLEASFRDKDYPIRKTISKLALSIMKWHGDLVIGGNLGLQFQLGLMTIVGRANLNSRRGGQISIRASSCDNTQMGIICLIPLLRSLGSNKI